MDNRAQLLQIMESFTTAMLVSRSTEDELRARPMAIADIDEQGHLWFITDRHSAKVDELERDPHVNVTMQNRDQYVSLSGHCRAVQDPLRVRELWSETWKVWFPNGPDDPEIILLRIAPIAAEYWDQAGTKGLSYLVRAGVAYLQGERPEVGQGQHGKVATGGTLP